METLTERHVFRKQVMQRTCAGIKPITIEHENLTYNANDIMHLHLTLLNGCVDWQKSNESEPMCCSLDSSFCCGITSRKHIPST